MAHGEVSRGPELTDAGRAGVAPSLEFEEYTFPYVHTHDDEDGAALPPESAPERTSAADGPPDDTEGHEGAAELSDPLGPWYRPLIRCVLERSNSV